MLSDSDLTNHTIMGALFFDKFDYETMRLAQMKRAQKVPATKTKLVKYFGVDCFQDMTAEEYEVK